MTRALVVDDTILYRSFISEVLQKIPDVEVVSTAPNGKIALAKIRTFRPDLVTLDVEMPDMNGIEVLEDLARNGPDTAVVVVSSLTERGGELTMRALELGAFDFITKPEGREARVDFEKKLGVIISSLAKRLEIIQILKGIPQASVLTGKPGGASGGAVNNGSNGDRAQQTSRFPPAQSGKHEIVAIGISTGGPQALMSMLPRLPAGIPAPILIVQHMPPLFTANLAKSLASKCGIRVKEAENGEVPQGGTVYIAPGGKQMKIALGADARTKLIRINDDPPENNCRPSVDYLFRSLAHLYYGKATAVVMTGMGTDGMRGAEALKRSGALVIAQDERTCTVFGMPKAVIDARLADKILPLDQIAKSISDSVI